MSLVSVNWNPGRKDLKVFRWMAVLMTGLIAAVLYYFRHVDVRWCLGLVGLGVLIWGSGLISLTLTRKIYVFLMVVTLPIGFVVSLILMSVFYFGLLTPLGLLFHLIGRDALHRRLDQNARTYWIAHPRVDRAERYFQQF